MYKLPLFYDYVFPNMILPNALITEFGIVNYLHTLNSNKLRNTSLFDDQPTETNHLTHLFGDALGSIPNSFGTHGSHLGISKYIKELICYENSLYFGKQATGKYIYPIKISPHINDFIGVNLRAGSKLNGEYFWKHMSAEALQDAQQGRALIFLDYAQENFVEKNTYINLHESLKYSGIPPNQIVLAFNSYNAQEIYESWFTPEERKIVVRNWPFVVSTSSFNYGSRHHPSMGFIEFKSNTHLRKNYFLFKIRRARRHRLALLYKMFSSGILSKGDWSCLTPIKYNDHVVSNTLMHYRLDIDIGSVEELHKSFPHSLQNEPDSNLSTVSAWTDIEYSAHMNSYFYVCTESFINTEYKSLTEKVFKPIVNFQPFLFMANRGALELLRSLGFKTFHPFIDESYDSESDEVKRLEMIYAEICRLCSMSIEEIHAWYWNMEDILIHNHNHIMEIHKSDSNSLDLVKYLFERINQ